MHNCIVSMSDLGASPIPLEEFPEQMQQMFLGYVAPLNKSIAVLLKSRDEEDFERNFQNAKREYLKYYTAIVSDISGGEFGLLLQKSFSSLEPVQGQVGFDTQRQRQIQPQTQPGAQTQVEAELTPIEQTLNDASRVIAEATTLLLYPAYQEHMLKHPDAWEPSKELMVYASILSYIQQKQAETNTGTVIEQHMVERIVQKCQEITHDVESFVDTISKEIRLDPELTATLDRTLRG